MKLFVKIAILIIAKIIEICGLVLLVLGVRWLCMSSNIILATIAIIILGCLCFLNWSWVSDLVDRKWKKVNQDLEEKGPRVDEEDFRKER